MESQGLISWDQWENCVSGELGFSGDLSVNMDVKSNRDLEVNEDKD